MTEETKEQEASTVSGGQNERLVMLHYYCFSYIGKDSETGEDCQASTYTGYPEKGITMPMIDENKKNACVNNGAVLLAVSYLGFMTRDAMQGT